MATEEGDSDALGEVEAESVSLVSGVEDLEFRSMLDEDDDDKNAIMVIH